MGGLVWKRAVLHPTKATSFSEIPIAWRAAEIPDWPPKFKGSGVQSSGVVVAVGVSLKKHPSSVGSANATLAEIAITNGIKRKSVLTPEATINSAHHCFGL
jgi:hypothetical protein